MVSRTALPPAMPAMAPVLRGKVGLVSARTVEGALGLRPSSPGGMLVLPLFPGTRLVDLGGGGGESDVLVGDEEEVGVRVGVGVGSGEDEGVKRPGMLPVLPVLSGMA